LIGVVIPMWVGRTSSLSMAAVAWLEALLAAALALLAEAELVALPLLLEPQPATTPTRATASVMAVPRFEILFHITLTSSIA
jgi:hypothetical protein